MFEQLHRMLTHVLSVLFCFSVATFIELKSKENQLKMARDS